MYDNRIYPTIRENRFRELISEDNGHRFLVVFTANWLGEGVIMDNIVKQLAQEYNHNFYFYRINADTSKELTYQLGIHRLPTLLFFSDGELVHRIQGMKSRKALQEKIDDILDEDN